MDFTHDAHDTEIGLAKSLYQTVRADLDAVGFHALSVCISGDPETPRYSGTFAKTSRGRPSRFVVALIKQQLVDRISALKSDDWVPYIIATTGSGSDAVYAAEFHKRGVDGRLAHPIVKFDMSLGEFEDENESQRKAGRLPIWADCAEGCYCAIYAENDNSTAWTVEAEEDFEDADKRFNALSASWVRADLVAYESEDSVMRLYIDAKIGVCKLLVNRTSAQFQAKRKALAEDGFFPYRITTFGSGDDFRITAIFATGDTPLERKLRTSSLPKQPAVDTVIQGYMKSHNIRGAALAIVQGTRLIYAQGYNFSEAAPRYPNVTPETRFRLASVSKTFCAVAIWRLMQLGKLGLSTKVLDALPAFVEQRLKAESHHPGVPNIVDRLKKLKVRHLLEGRSGLSQKRSTHSVEASVGGLPCKSWDLAHHILASMPQFHDPDDIDITRYGKADNVLLGLIVRHTMGEPSFESALRKLVLDPLKMTRTRSARTLRADQEEDEARYHLSVINDDMDPIFRTAESVMSGERPLVPLQYGGHHYEIFDGAAGLSSAVVDVARLGAMLASEDGSPVLSKSRRRQMLEAGAEAYAAAVEAEVEDPQGFHGFDFVIKNLDGSFSFSKGGSIDGVRTRLAGRTNGRIYAFAFNGDKRKGGRADWYEALKDAAKTVDWSETDLFPTFGMPSLEEKAVKSVAVVDFDDLLDFKDRKAV